MGLLIASIVLTVVLLLAGIGIGIYNVVENDTGKGFFSLFGAPLGLIILLFGCFRSVKANQVGIIYDDRSGVLEETLGDREGVVERTYGEGFGTKSIFEHITSISTTNRTATVTTTGQTNDGQYATFELSLIYKVDKDNAGKFYKVTGSDDISSDDLNSIVKKCLQSSTINFNIFELLSEGLESARVDFFEDLKADIFDGHKSEYEARKAELDALIEQNATTHTLSEEELVTAVQEAKALESKIQMASGYYITLVSVSFDDVDAGSEIESILQAKAEAEQKIEIAQKEAQAAKITAQNEAEVKKLLADAESYATKVNGEAQGEAESAYVNKIVGMVDDLHTNMPTLSYNECAQIVLSIIFYDTWNGILPEVMTGEALEGLIGGLISKTTSTNSGN